MSLSTVTDVRALRAHVSPSGAVVAIMACMHVTWVLHDDDDDDDTCIRVHPWWWWKKVSLKIVINNQWSPSLLHSSWCSRTLKETYPYSHQSQISLLAPLGWGTAPSSFSSSQHFIAPASHALRKLL